MARFFGEGYMCSRKANFHEAQNLDESRGIPVITLVKGMANGEFELTELLHFITTITKTLNSRRGQVQLALWLSPNTGHKIIDALMNE